MATHYIMDIGNPVYANEKITFDARYLSVERNKLTATSRAACKDVLRAIELRGGSPSEAFTLHGFKMFVVRAAYAELQADRQAEAQALAEVLEGELEELGPGGAP